MIRLRYIHVVLTVLTALLAACTADDRELYSTGEPIHEPVQVTIDSPNMSVTRSTVSTGNTWAGNEKIVLVVGNKVGNGDTPASQTDHVYTVSGEGTSRPLSPFNIANTNYWTSTTEKKKIVKAWSYGTGIVPTLSNHAVGSYTLPTPQTDTSGELLYSPGAASKLYTASPNTFALTFYHQLAKVVFNVKADVNVSVTGATMLNIPTTATLTTPTTAYVNGWTSLGTLATVTPVGGTTIKTAGPSTTATYSAVLIPGDYKGKTLLKLVTANGNYSYTVPSESAFNLLPGKCYTFTIVIKNKVMLGTVSVTEWVSNSATNLVFQ